MKRRESDSFLMLFLKLRGGINVYYKNNILPLCPIYIYYLKSATTRLYDTEAKIICIVSKKGAQCIECHHKDI